jgi:hypothetical protein
MSRKSGRAKGVVCGLLLRCDRAERCDLTCSFREGGTLYCIQQRAVGSVTLGVAGARARVVSVMWQESYIWAYGESSFTRLAGRGS